MVITMPAIHDRNQVANEIGRRNTKATLNCGGVTYRHATAKAVSTRVMTCVTTRERFSMACVMFKMCPSQVGRGLLLPQRLNERLASSFYVAMLKAVGVQVVVWAQRMIGLVAVEKTRPCPKSPCSLLEGATEKLRVKGRLGASEIQGGGRHSTAGLP